MSRKIELPEEFSFADGARARTPADLASRIEAEPRRASEVRQRIAEGDLGRWLRGGGWDAMAQQVDRLQRDGAECTLAHLVGILRQAASNKQPVGGSGESATSQVTPAVVADKASVSKTQQLNALESGAAEVGRNYLGRVVRLVDFGAFVEIMPETEGLLHIREISENRVRDVHSELKEGDEILVKVLAVEGTKIKLSRKAVLREQQNKPNETSAGPAVSKPASMAEMLASAWLRPGGTADTKPAGAPIPSDLAERRRDKPNETGSSQPVGPTVSKPGSIAEMLASALLRPGNTETTRPGVRGPSRLAERQREAFRSVTRGNAAQQKLESSESEQIAAHGAAGRQKSASLKALAAAERKKAEDAWTVGLGMLRRANVAEPQHSDAVVISAPESRLDRCVATVSERLVSLGTAVRALEDGRIKRSKLRRRLVLLLVGAGIAAAVFFAVQQNGGFGVDSSPAARQSPAAPVQVPAEYFFGEWRGKVDNSPATLEIIPQNTPDNWSGRFNYQGVIEEVRVTRKDTGGLVLTGKSYKRISGRGTFYLDTFNGQISGDGQSILGSWVDATGKRGQWSVVKVAAPAEKHGEAAPEASPATVKTSVTIQGNRDWTDTGINLLQNDTVSISATGSVKMTAAGHVPDIPSMSPSGYPPDCAAASRAYGPFSQRAMGGFPSANLPCWSLIGRVGAQGPIFEVASEKTLTVTAPGELYLGVNDENASDNSGDWIASITVLHQGEAASDKSAYQNRICEGSDDGEPNEIFRDHTSEEIDLFAIQLRPGCFSGYILIPESWKSYTMEATDPAENWWMAYKWYPKNSGSGERPPLTAQELSRIGPHTSQKIRVQGSGRLLIHESPGPTRKGK
jgi:predicted RNA-binding protein with RPS1 domain